LSTATTSPTAPPTVPTSPARTTLRLEARKGWQALNFREVWKYRELLGFLAMRDIKVRYKQTVLGVLWAVIQPLMTMVVFTVLFALLMGRGNQPTVAGVPYAISTFCALLPWQFFASVLGQSGNSLVSNTNLLKKIYFPRLIMPLSTVLSSLVDFLVAFAVLLGMMGVYWLMGSYQPTLSFNLLMLPLFMLLAIISGLGVGLWIAALNVKYRDFKYVMPFLIQLGTYVTPVVYTAAVIPERYRTLYFLNPMAGVTEGFRWAILGRSSVPVAMVLISASIAALLFVGGLFYFRRMEKEFADLA